MRYLKLIAIAAFIFWTYNFVNKPLPVKVITHNFIQQDIKGLIIAKIKEALPDAQNIRFNTIQTEVKAANLVIASFVYGFSMDSEMGEQRIEVEGSAELNRLPDSDDGTEAWSLDKIHMGDDTLEFIEPAVIEVEL